MGMELAVIDNELAVVDQLINSIFDADTAKDAASTMDKLKKWLDLAEQFGAYASQFCTKEAEMYVRIAEVGGAEKLLAKAQRDLVHWIRSKNKEELAAILEECASGCRINTIRNRELRANKAALEGSITDGEYKRIRSVVLDEFRSKGRTTISPQRFYDEWALPSMPDKVATKAFTEKTRDDLIHLGGVGIADGVGTYINPDTQNRGEVAQAISARLKSIYADMSALVSLCKQARFSVPSEGIQMLNDLLQEIEEVCR